MILPHGRPSWAALNTVRLRGSWLVALVVTGLLATCRNSTQPTPGRVEIVSRVEAMFPGQSESLLVAIDSVLVDPRAVRWATSAPGVLSVDTSGMVSAAGLGVAAIVARAATNSDTVSIQVIEPAAGRIAFVGMAQEPQRGDAFRLYEIQANGQGLRPLGGTWLSGVGQPAFSPDGSMLAVPVGYPPRIQILSGDAGRWLYEPTQGMGCGASGPAWAPDGRTIAFSSCASGQFDVWVSTLDGSSRRQVTRFAQFFAQTTAFTPDGAALIVAAFVHDSTSPNPQAGQTELFHVEIATGASRRLTATRDHEEWPFVDTGRARLYFSRTLLDAPGSRPRAEAVALFLSDLEVRAAEQLTPLGLTLAGFAFDAKDPHASPDGEWVVFSLNTEQYPLPSLRIGDFRIGVRPEIYVMRLQDRLMVRLSHFWSAAQPSWTTR